MRWNNNFQRYLLTPTKFGTTTCLKVILVKQFIKHAPETIASIQEAYIHQNIIRQPTGANNILQK